MENNWIISIWSGLVVGLILLLLNKLLAKIPKNVKKSVKNSLIEKVDIDIWNPNNKSERSQSLKDYLDNKNGKKDKVAWKN